MHTSQLDTDDRIWGALGTIHSMGVLLISHFFGSFANLHRAKGGTLTDYLPWASVSRVTVPPRAQLSSALTARLQSQ